MKNHHKQVEEELQKWFFETYIPHWVSVGSGAVDQGSDFILEYWGTPMYACDPPIINQWLLTDAEVIKFLEYNHKPLKESDYHHTNVPDRRITVFNEDSASIEVIWSRCRKDDSEIERLACNFLVGKIDGKWKALGITARDTTKSTMDEAWAEELLTDASIRSAF